jgi:hypothetical protein
MKENKYEAPFKVYSVLSVQQKRNLAKLALYLKRMRRNKKFNMMTYMNVDVENDKLPRYALDAYEKYSECGTSACAVGHAPFIGPEFIPLAEETWVKYCERLFTSAEKYLYDQWCFFFHYSHMDVPLYAAIRIAYTLQTGYIPKETRFCCLFPDNDWYHYWRKKINWQYIQNIADGKDPYTIKVDTSKIKFSNIENVSN